MYGTSVYNVSSQLFFCCNACRDSLVTAWNKIISKIRSRRSNNDLSRKNSTLSLNDSSRKDSQNGLRVAPVENNNGGVAEGGEVRTEGEDDQEDKEKELSKKRR